LLAAGRTEDFSRQVISPPIHLIFLLVKFHFYFLWFLPGSFWLLARALSRFSFAMISAWL